MDRLLCSLLQAKLQNAHKQDIYVYKQSNFRFYMLRLSNADSGHFANILLVALVSLEQYTHTQYNFTTKCFSTIKTQWNPGQLSLCRPGNTWSYSHKMAPPLPVSCLYWVALKLVSAPSTISTSIDQPSNQIVQFLVI